MLALTSSPAPAGLKRSRNSNSAWDTAQQTSKWGCQTGETLQQQHPCCPPPSITSQQCLCFQSQHKLSCLVWLSAENQLQVHPPSYGDTLSTRSWKDKGTQATKSVQKSSSHSTTAAHTLGYPRKAQVTIFQLLQLASTLLIGLFYKKRFHLKLQNVFFFSYCIHYVQTQLFLILTCHHSTICTELQRWSS